MPAAIVREVTVIRILFLLCMLYVFVCVQGRWSEVDKIEVYFFLN